MWNSNVTNKIRDGGAIIALRNTYEVLKYLTYSERFEAVAVDVKDNKALY